MPPEPAGFAGRSEELRQLDGILLDRRGAAGRAALPVALLAGPPGVGKSAVALHWAHRRRAAFPDGQLYADLGAAADEGAADPAGILASFLADLGLPGDRQPPATEERAAAFRALVATRRMLVVLDNSDPAAQLWPLIPGTPLCAVLITSRDARADLVSVVGARRLEMTPLPAAAPSAAP